METVKREMSDYPQQVHRIPRKNNAGLRKTIRFLVRFVIPQIKSIVERTIDHEKNYSHYTCVYHIDVRFFGLHKQSNR